MLHETTQEESRAATMPLVAWTHTDFGHFEILCRDAPAMHANRGPLWLPSMLQKTHGCRRLNNNAQRTTSRLRRKKRLLRSMCP